MASTVDLRRAILGADSTVTRTALGVAFGLFSVAGVVVLVREFTSLSPGIELSYLFVLLGLALAAVSAYHNSGLVVSWILAFAPAAGPLAVYAWIMSQERASPVALPASFDGQGAASFWVPAALLLGTLGFGLGVLGRWVSNALADT